MGKNDYINFIEMSPVTDGMPTNRTICGVRETMQNYLDSVNQLTKYNKRNPNSYRVKEVYLVGSGVDGKIDSDLDLVLVVPKIDSEDASKIKVDLAKKLFCNRNKKEALDVFVGNVDFSRPNMNVTSYVGDILKEYNPISNRRA